MTPEQLKASILQMAIQGKLVEQRSEEGTAEELFLKIAEQRNRLIKDNVLKKNRPLKPININDLPFELPPSWKWVKWGDIVNVVSARRVHQSDWQKEGIPFYRAREIAEMSRNNGQVDNELFISDELYEEFSKSGVPKPGDIMVTAVGTLGKTYIVKEGDKFYYKDASVICFENHFNMCAEYLSMMMDTPFMKQQIKSNSDGTTVSTLTMVRMNEYLFPLPPVEEQHRIISKIEELIPYIEKYAVSYEKLEQFNSKFPEDMKKSILQYAIQGKLVEQRPEEGTAETLYRHIQEKKQKLIQEGKLKKEKALANIMEDEIPFDIPESWKWVRLSNLCKSITDGDHQPPPQTEEGYPFVVISNISYGRLDISNTRHVGEDYFNSLSEDRIAERGDLLFTVTGSYGIVIKVDTDEKFCFQRHIALLKILNCREYLFYALQSPFVKKSCDELSTGIAQKTVGLTTLRNMLIPLPPLEEQKRIVDRIEELMPLCNKLAK